MRLKQQITGKIWNSGTKDAEIMVPLKYLSNFLTILKISLINCEISFQWQWSEKYISLAGTAAKQVTEFKAPATKLYVPVVTLSTQDNVKLA